MTSPFSFSLRLCFKLWKGCCTIVNVCWHMFCPLHTGKVHRWKFFHCLCGFIWQLTEAYLSVKWVINPSHLMYDFSFSFFFNFFTHNFCMWNLSWLNMSALTLVWQAQQQQHQQQQQQCKCCTGMCLEADSSQGPHSLQCVHCCSYSCGCWCWFSSLCWSAAAHSVCSFSSDKSHSCAAQCECSVCMTMHHIEPGEDSLTIIHKHNSDSESGCVGFCRLSQLSDTQYDTLFEMSLYIRTFQWMLQ